MVWLHDRIGNWGIVGALLGIAFLLGMELREFVEGNGLWPTGVSSLQVIPPPSADNEIERDSVDPRRFVTTTEAMLRKPIAFTLRNGVLRVTGTIDEGTAIRLARVLDTRGDMVRSVSLNSPGGALDDAIAMGRLLRAYGLPTTVENGAICASSCPLAFAGGVRRTAGAQAAIGLHQFYAASDTTEIPAEIMADAQLTTARISRHLVEMGVNPALWLHALETPPRALYYLDAGQMRHYRLVTEPEEKLAYR